MLKRIVCKAEIWREMKGGWRLGAMAGAGGANGRSKRAMMPLIESSRWSDDGIL